jgi:hypothetical protein
LLPGQDLRAGSAATGGVAGDGAAGSVPGRGVDRGKFVCGVFFGIVPLLTLTGPQLALEIRQMRLAALHKGVGHVGLRFRHMGTHRSETFPQVEHVAVGPFRGLPCRSTFTRAASTSRPSGPGPVGTPSRWRR